MERIKENQVILDKLAAEPDRVRAIAASIQPVKVEEIAAVKKTIAELETALAPLPALAKKQRMAGYASEARKTVDQVSDLNVALVRQRIALAALEVEQAETARRDFEKAYSPLNTSALFLEAVHFNEAIKRQADFDLAAIRNQIWLSDQQTAYKPGGETEARQRLKASQDALKALENEPVVIGA